jgi:hypothetical protein
VRRDVDSLKIDKIATGATRPRIYAKMFTNKPGSVRLNVPSIFKEKNRVDYNAITLVG